MRIQVFWCQVGCFTVADVIHHPTVVCVCVGPLRLGRRLSWVNIKQLFLPPPSDASAYNNSQVVPLIIRLVCVCGGGVFVILALSKRIGSMNTLGGGEKKRRGVRVVYSDQLHCVCLSCTTCQLPASGQEGHSQYLREAAQRTRASQQSS